MDLKTQSNQDIRETLARPNAVAQNVPPPTESSNEDPFASSDIRLRQNAPKAQEKPISLTPVITDIRFQKQSQAPKTNYSLAPNFKNSWKSKTPSNSKDRNISNDRKESGKENQTKVVTQENNY